MNNTNNEQGDSFYKNDATLPALGSTHNYTEDEAREIIKCKRDPAYFIKNYIRVNNLDKGIVPFVLYPYQEKLIEQYHNNRFCLSMLGRQMGKCLTGDSKIRIRDKNKKEFEITCQEFYEWCKFQEFYNEI